MSNDSDLRAAAERICQIKSEIQDIDCEIYQEELLTNEAANLGHKLAVAFLASQPADGEEAISAETEFVKFTDKLGLQCRWRLLHSEDGYVFVWHQAAMAGGYPIDWNDVDEYDAVNILVTTDRDVRRLCGVLGITLKEGST